MKFAAVLAAVFCQTSTPAAQRPAAETAADGAETLSLAPGQNGLAVVATTDFPVFVGGELTFDLPLGFVIGGGVGGVPSAYLRVTGELVSEYAGFSDAETEVVTEALSGRWVARAYFGWRPDPDFPLYFRVGYAALNLSGELSDAVELARSTNLPPAIAQGATARMTSTLHGVEAQVGLRWLYEGFVFRVALGFFGTLGAQARIDIIDAPDPTEAERLAREGEALLEDTYRQYVFTPSVGLAVGYRFGFE